MCAGRVEHSYDGFGAHASDPTGAGVEFFGVLLRDFELPRAVRVAVWHAAKRLRVIVEAWMERGRGMDGWIACVGAWWIHGCGGPQC